MAIKNIQDAELFAGLIQKIASDMGSIKKENLLETVPQLFQIIKTAVLDDPINTKSIVMEPSVGYEMIGAPIGFTKTDHGSEIDIIIPGVIEITRGENGGIYNSAQETSFDNDYGLSPLGTEWNSNFTDPTNNGFDDLSNVSERIYDTWSNALQGDPDTNILGTDFIMKDLISDRYWILYFDTWTTGSGGGGFSYTRQEMKIVPISSITFPDGSKMSSAAISSASTWNMSGVAFVSPIGSDTLGVVGDGNKPYATIKGAANHSSMILVLPGTYSELVEINTNSTVRIHAMSGVIFTGRFLMYGTGSIYLTGNSNFNSSTDVMTVQGSVKVVFEFDNLITTGSAWNVSEGGSNLYIYGKGIITGNSARSGAVLGDSNIYINLIEDLVIKTCLDFRKPARNVNDYRGKFIVNCRNIIMDNSINQTNGIGSVFNITNPGAFYFDINANIIQLSTSTTSGILWVGAASVDGSKIYLRKNIYTANGDIAIRSVNSTSYLEITGSIFAPNGSAFSIGSLSSGILVHCVIRECRIQSKYKNIVGAGIFLEAHNSSIKVTDNTQTGIFTAIVSGKPIQNIKLYNTMLYLANASGEVMQNDVAGPAASVMNTVNCRSNVTTGPAIDNWEGIIDFSTFTLPDIEIPVLP